MQSGMTRTPFNQMTQLAFETTRNILDIMRPGSMINSVEIHRALFEQAPGDTSTMIRVLYFDVVLPSLEKATSLSTPSQPEQTR